ncbi:MAG: hypothetical protein A2033_04710 [Bacteroidetes bacterium GWA2_31_9]|nr:MAG: hypothetical protein A2033_04710 [Bacteroidetes bacterium GWA2_31_9]
MKTLLSIIYTISTSILFQNANFAQAPDLGAASGFALFTAVGAFDNIGITTTVTGDVGTNGGAFNAFPQGILNGNIYLPGDALAAQASIDIDLAFNNMTGITCGVVLGTDLGNDQILTPDVYCTGAASTISGNLTLDAQGDPDALFIFKIGGALSANLSSSVILINSASICNVYWQITGAFDTGNNANFSGTVIASGPISLNTGTSLNGRSLTTAGAVYIDKIVADLPCSAASLPIELLYFRAIIENNHNLLSWSTASETNNNYFTLESTTDRKNFKEVETIKAAGNSNTIIQYSASDYNLYEGILYYRLKQTDFDGKFTYSNIVMVDFDKPLKFNIAPNPFNTSLSITINDESQINICEIRMYDIFGKQVVNSIISKQLTILETSNFSSGIYFYKVISNGKTIHSGKLISQ